MRKSDQLQIGKAGEYLVCADLILKGFIAFPSEQGLSYDVLLDTGEKILKVQVKTTITFRNVQQRPIDTKCYIFNVRRKGRFNKKIYGLKEIDLFALVSLSERKVAYMTNAETPCTLNFRVDCFRGMYYDEKGIADHKKVTELLTTGISQSEIGRQIGVDQSTINKIVKNGFKPHLSKARYFSDYFREKEWFENL